MTKQNRIWTDPDTVDAIRDEPPWETCQELADKYGVCVSTISNIRRGKTHNGGNGGRLTQRKREAIDSDYMTMVQELSIKHELAESRVLSHLRKFKEFDHLLIKILDPTATIFAAKETPLELYNRKAAEAAETAEAAARKEKEDKDAADAAALKAAEDKRVADQIALATGQ